MNGRMNRKRHEKKMIITAKFIIGIILYLAAAISVQANDAATQDGIEQNQTITEFTQMMMAVGETDAREQPNESAEVVVSYDDGAPIYVTGETEDGWYRVRYQDLTGYVKAEQVTKMELDVTALNDEFAIEEEEGRLVVEEVERQRKEVRRSKVWGMVIILLVLGVFITGIVSTVKNGGKENEYD